MKTTLCIFVSTLAMTAFLVTSVQAQTSTDTNALEAQVVNSNDVGLDTVKVAATPTDDEIRKMNIFDACKALGVNSDYNTRYRTIIIPLCEEGVMIFPPSQELQDLKADLEKSGRDASLTHCYEYSGDGPQNATLIRNMVANKHLIKNGKLVPSAAKKWKVVK